MARARHGRPLRPATRGRPPFPTRQPGPHLEGRSVPSATMRRGARRPLDDLETRWTTPSGPRSRACTPTSPSARGPAPLPRGRLPFGGLADQADPPRGRTSPRPPGRGHGRPPALASTPRRASLVTSALPGVQLVATTLRLRPGDDVPGWSSSDPTTSTTPRPRRAHPARPFGRRTRVMGRYLGIREDGRLLAMAGERLRLGAATEISAVCTDPSARGRGLATTLVRAVAHGIRERGDCRSCTPPRTTRGRSGSTSTWGFACGARSTSRRADPAA